jgi:hypothetical protein
MHYYEKNIVDIKNIYTDFLLNMLSPLVFEGIKSMYNKAILVEKDYEKAMLEDEKITNPGVLKIFQHFLKGIPSLNINLIEAEMIRIRDTSKNADIFEKLIRAVFKSYIILLTYNASGKECILVREKYHDRIDIKDFIHKIYIESAKHFYNNPELFWHNFPSLEIKKNHAQCIDIIKNAIKESILKVIPLNDILTEYLRNEYIQENSVQQIRTMLDKEEVINHYDGGSIVNSNDNGIEENNNLEENIELDDRNNLIGQLNNLNNQDGGLILNQESLINSQEQQEQLNSSDEYKEKLNSLGGAFYNANKKISNTPEINKQEVKHENQPEQSDTKINIVKPTIVEQKISNINKEDYYKAMFSEK